MYWLPFTLFRQMSEYDETSVTKLQPYQDTEVHLKWQAEQRKHF